jgi:extradiol dioxygenase family protein
MGFQFHISLPCKHIDATRKFYQNIIGANIGRATSSWLDVDMYGNQITFTKCGDFKFDYPSYTFEKTVLPSFHIGVILPAKTWKEIYSRMKSENFLHIDNTRFLKGKTGQHDSFFLRDPNGYIIEFKCFKDEEEVFAS